MAWPFDRAAGDSAALAGRKPRVSDLHRIAASRSVYCAIKATLPAASIAYPPNARRSSGSCKGRKAS
jgi:hypothetical protein